ncbi:hypothetical protein ABIF70_007516 [Bradyrhizobium japonicum]
MLNRLTVSALLKAVIAITSVCVVIALSLTAYASWDRLKTANRISQIADASADLFKAMHNLRTDRSTTSRLLNATEPMDSEIERYLRALRDAQMPAMARALELLPSIDFPQSGTLVPELARLYKLLGEEQKQFWEDVAKPKDQRRAGLTKEYMETTQGLLDVLDKLSGVLAATVNHQDAVIDQLLSIKQSAWLLRNTAGEASLIVSTGLAAGKITPEGRYNYTQFVGGTAAMWKALELSTSGMQLPPALASAMTAAKTAYFEPQYLTLRDRLADTLVKGEKAELTANQWSPLTVGRMASAVAVAEAALDAARSYTQEQRSTAQRALIVQLALWRLPSASLSAQSCWSAAASSIPSTPSATPCSRSPAATLPSTAAISTARTRSARLLARWKPSSSRRPRSSRSKSRSASAMSARPRASAPSRPMSASSRARCARRSAS